MKTEGKMRLAIPLSTADDFAAHGRVQNHILVQTTIPCMVCFSPCM